MKFLDFISDVLNSAAIAIVFGLIALALALALGWIDIATLTGWLFQAPSF